MEAVRCRRSPRITGAPLSVNEMRIVTPITFVSNRSGLFVVEFLDPGRAGMRSSAGTSSNSELTDTPTSFLRTSDGRADSQSGVRDDLNREGMPVGLDVSELSPEELLVRSQKRRDRHDRA